MSVERHGRRKSAWAQCSAMLFLSIGAVVLTACGAANTAAPGANPTPASAATAPTANAPAVANVGSKPKSVRIGYQKGGTLAILKAQGALEKRLGTESIGVEWLLFPSGPPLLEAMNTGSIDIGTTGEPPPIVAQAAGTPLVYVAATPANPQSNAIVVPQDSPIQRVAELKGKKIAVAKGSSAHYLLVRALQDAGLKYEDVTPVFLQPGDARTAFEGKNVDAWVIWDPFLAVARKDGNARVLRDGNGLIAARGFYLATRDFAASQANLLTIVLDEIGKVERWTGENTAEAAKLASAEIGVPAPILEELNKSRAFGLGPVDDGVIADQQKVADLFFSLGLIPKQIQVKEALPANN